MKSNELVMDEYTYYKIDEAHEYYGNIFCLATLMIVGITACAFLYCIEDSSFAMDYRAVKKYYYFLIYCFPILINVIAIYPLYLCKDKLYRKFLLNFHSVTVSLVCVITHLFASTAAIITNLGYKYFAIQATVFLIEVCITMFVFGNTPSYAREYSKAKIIQHAKVKSMIFRKSKSK